MSSKRVYEAVARVVAETVNPETHYANGLILVRRLADVFQELEMCQSCMKEYEFEKHGSPSVLGREWTLADHIDLCEHCTDKTTTCHQFNRETWERACRPSGFAAPDPDITHWPPVTADDLP
jgi:hypothetical protein